jgi:ABC-type branched-subunit amino acid transport system permease subunit
MRLLIKRSAIPLLIAGAALLPLVLATPYYVRVMTLAGIFVVLAVSYDLVAGQVGALSLAHPAFYGIGAYAVAILVTRQGWSFPAAFGAAAAISAAMAVVVGIPSFRLHESTFAIGTLGMLLIIKLVANNWIELTEGPMCVTHVPSLQFSLPGGLILSNSSLQGGYYGVLALALIVIALVHALNSSRVGRAFRAVRENDLLAEMQGVNVLSYRMLAFAVGAAIAGIAGGYYVTWSSLVCPTEMELYYMITLLIILNIGGAGSLRGVVTAAIAFTILPELLRISTELRLVIYGVILLVFALYLPEGFEGLIRSVDSRLRLGGAAPGSGQDPAETSVPEEGADHAAA